MARRGQVMRHSWEMTELSLWFQIHSTKPNLFSKFSVCIAHLMIRLPCSAHWLGHLTPACSSSAHPLSWPISGNFPSRRNPVSCLPPARARTDHFPGLSPMEINTHLLLTFLFYTTVKVLWNVPTRLQFFFQVLKHLSPLEPKGDAMARLLTTAFLFVHVILLA